jgi:hydrogenase-4 membrane subunit HyfE
MDLIGFVQTLLIPLEVLLVIITLLITAEKSILGVIKYYQFQTLTLTVVVILTALTKLVNKGANNFWLLLGIAALPGFLWWFILPVLQRATIVDQPRDADQPQSKRIQTLLRKPWRLPDFLFSLTETKRAQVLRIWKNSEPEQRLAELQDRAEETGIANAQLARSKLKDRSGRDLIISGLLWVLSFSVAFLIFPLNKGDSTQLSKSISLGVSLCLHLIGLYNTTVKRDIISLVIGILIMDHGLYLAVVKIVEVPVPAGLFVLALYTYTVITILILLFMVPQVIRSIAEEDVKERMLMGDQLIGQPTIDLDQIASSSPLKET